MEANSIRNSLISKRASKQSLKLKQFPINSSGARDSAMQYNSNGQEMELQSVISGMLNTQLQERNKFSILSSQGEGVVNIPDLLSVRRRASLIVANRGSVINKLESTNNHGFSGRHSRRSITTSAHGKEQNNLEVISQFMKKEDSWKNSGMFKPRTLTNPNLAFTGNTQGSLQRSPNKGPIDMPFLKLDSSSPISSLDNKRMTHDYPHSQDNSPNKYLTSDSPYSPSVFLSQRERSTKSFNIKSKPRLTTSIEKVETKTKKAYKYFNDIKTSIDMFEKEQHESGGHGKLLGMGKDILLDKYIKRQTIQNFNIQHELSSPDKLKNHPNISKTRLSKLKSNKEENEEQRTSVSNTDANLVSNNTDHTKLNHNTFKIMQIDTNRKLQKVNKVLDSLSSDDENLLELMLQNTASSLTIDPNSNFKKTWDFLLTAITAYALLFTPYYIAFIEEDIPFLKVLELVFDLFFILDIVLNFFVAYYNSEEELIRSLYLIAKNYIFGWLFLDVLASIPGSLILYIMDPSQSSSNSKSISAINKATRFTKLYRMVKFTKLVKIFKLSNDEQKTVKLVGVEEMNLSSAVQRFIQFILTFIVVSHMLSCIWIYIGKSFNPNWIYAINYQDISDGSLYVASLYFHWTTIFTVGYGDILSTNTIERTYNCVLMFVGILVYSFAVSSMGTILTTYDSITSLYYKKIELVDDLRLEYKLPDYFYNKLTKYLKYNFQFNKNERLTFINELPKKSRSELLNEMYKDIITNFNFLNGCSKDFISRIVFSMRPMKAHRKENLVLEGEYLEEVIFVRKGTLGVHLGSKYNGIKVMEIRRNEHFGDVLIISKTKSPVSINVSSKFADLLIIRRQEFIEISKEFPEEFEDAVLLSAYNFLVMLEIAEQKKIKIGGHQSPVKKLDEVVNEERRESTLFDVFEEEDKQTNLEMIEEENALDESEENPKEQQITSFNNLTNDDSTPNETKSKGDSFIAKSLETLKNLAIRNQNDKLDKKTFNVNFIIQNNNFINSGEATNRSVGSKLSNRSNPNNTSAKSEEKVNKSEKVKEGKNNIRDTQTIKEDWESNQSNKSKNSFTSSNRNSCSNSNSSKSSSSPNSSNTSLANKSCSTPDSNDKDYNSNNNSKQMNKNNLNNNYDLKSIPPTNNIIEEHKSTYTKNRKQVKLIRYSSESDSDTNSIPFSDGDAIDQDIVDKIPKSKKVKIRTTLALQLSNKLLNKVQNSGKPHKNIIVKKKLKNVLVFNQRNLGQPFKRYSEAITENFNLANVTSMLRKRDEEREEREEREGKGEKGLYSDFANKNKIRKMKTHIPKDYDKFVKIEREMIKSTEEQNKKLERFLKRVSVKFNLKDNPPIFNV